MKGTSPAGKEHLLRRLRKICLRLPEATETIKWGNPTFVAGKKLFAVLDRYHGRWCIAFRTEPQQQTEILGKPGFFAAPYVAKYGWVCLDAEEGQIDWVEVEDLVVASYRTVALKRMLAAM